MSDRSFLQQRVSLLDQRFKLFRLLRDPVRVAIFILGARECGGLLDQLPDILAGDGDALFELGESKVNCRCSSCLSRVRFRRPSGLSS